MSGPGNGKGTSRPRVSVVGGGAWGVALATAAANAGSEVLLYTRRPQNDLPSRVQHTQSLRDVARHARTILVAVPSIHVSAVTRELGDHLDGRHVLVHGVRGLVTRPSRDPAFEGDDLVTISAVLRDTTPSRRFGALGGPVLTEELAAGAPSVLVVASHYPEVLEAVRGVLGGSGLRIYPTEDLIGLEWASALVSILAVAIGYARGAGLGAGLVSAFAIRGVHEAARVAVAAGADERTFLGLGGIGDLLATMSQEERPEVRLGEALARGEAPDRAAAALGQRIEALDLAPAVAAFAQRHGVSAPILTAVAHGLGAQRSVDEMLQRLMTSPMQNQA
jgi:glycerol-3-phosphate dehydrogenase (NAD(P)+)